MIVIDADGCPVVNLTLDIAQRFGVKCCVVADTSHSFDFGDKAEIITVSKGADSADFRIVNLIKNGDIVITQDYGLAAMCLAKTDCVLNQNGLIYSQNNIDSLLDQRHISKKIRRAGGRTKGPAKRTAEQDEKFSKALISILKKGLWIKPKSLIFYMRLFVKFTFEAFDRRLDKMLVNKQRNVNLRGCNHADLNVCF